MAAARRRLEGRTVRLRPHDPFELIRWLARTQSDPRKAVAELVQNSLDAGARHVTLLRRRVRGTSMLVVRDDGEGVIPESTREGALDYLATHVGHSRKLGLTPSERRERVVAGQYGIGLLGFWSIGRRFEMRSRVGGSDLWALRLVENDPKAEILRMPLPVDAPATFTEVIVAELHAPAERALAGRRLTDYLAAELRGQLLGRDVELVVEDLVARGTAQKRFVVAPRKFTGERMRVPDQVPVEGHSPLRVELYLSRGGEPPGIHVACAGTLVADDVAELSALGLAEPPWVGRSLSGIVDFAGFHVPPGTRRGVMPDRAAAAFVAAMESLRPQVESELARLDRERVEAASRDVVREIERALRGLQARLPHYDLPGVATPSTIGGRGRGAKGVALDEAIVEDVEPAATSGSGQHSPPALDLFPPGPLARAAIVPVDIAVRPGAERRVRAAAYDAEGRELRDELDVDWSCDATFVEVRGEGVRPAIVVAADATPEATATLRVRIERRGRAAEAEATIRVAGDDQGVARHLGIPEPRLVSDATASWRSRMHGDCWEVNDAHEDWLAIRADPRARVRYLLSLFAKEIVHRSFGKPGDDALLERMVEILSYAERNLRGVERRNDDGGSRPESA